MKKVDISLQKTNFIKGLAILAVVFVHVLAYFPGIYHGDKQILFISLDQLARFCMPVFIMLSGYGLASKYEGEKLAYLPFIKSRILKLLPLYFLWSIYSILIIKSVPAWSFGNQPMSIFIQIFFGQADYQLYFLPVIFQLYALFPFIWQLRKKPSIMFFSALAIQAISFYLYTLQTTNSDRLQYALFSSWIAYFVLGIYLKVKAIPNLLLKLAWPLAIITFAWLSFSSLSQINHGLDPLPALKFTRLIVIPFALSASLALATFNYQKENFLGKIFSFFGQNSYLIFLSHTIALRIIYTIINQKLDFYPLLAVIFSWLLIVWISQKSLANKQNKTVINR